jgi:hypothetical protein
LAVHIAEGDVLGYESPGCGARDRVGDVDPCDASVGAGRSPHEAGGVFGKAAELRAYRRESRGLVKGRALSELPCTRLGRDERNIHDLEVGRGCGGVGLDVNKAQYGKEVAHMLEDTCDVRRGWDGRRGNEDAGSGIEGRLENDVGIDIFPEVGVDLLDKLRGDGIGADGRSGRRR